MRPWLLQDVWNGKCYLAVQVRPETHIFNLFSSSHSLNLFLFLNLSLFLYLYKISESIHACTLWWCVVSSVKCWRLSCYHSLGPLFHTHTQMHKLHFNNHINDGCFKSEQQLEVCSSDFQHKSKTCLKKVKQIGWFYNGEGCISIMGSDFRRNCICMMQSWWQHANI